MRPGTALVGILALLFLLHGPSLTSAAWTNAGMLPLRDGLLAQADLAPSAYPFYAVLNETPATARAMENLRRAANLNKNSLAARWALGHAALALGDGEIAAGMLEPLLKKAEVGPLSAIPVMGFVVTTLVVWAAQPATKVATTMPYHVATMLKRELLVRCCISIC